MVKVGNIIHKYVSESSFSIRSLSEATYISTSTLNLIFNGKRVLSCDVASRFIDVFDKELVYSWLRYQTEYDIWRLDHGA